MTHPREMHLSALHYHISEALKDAYVIDFLSDRAQNSIISFLAVELQKFYEFRTGPYREMEWPEAARWDRDNMPFFEKATLRHPLSALFGDTLAKAVGAVVGPYFVELEKNAKS